MFDLVISAKEKMQKTVESLVSDLKTLRTGRANAMILENIEAQYYGSPIPINQICSISVPEPRQIVVKPYSKEDLKSVLAAIASSDIGINPINDGDSIRLIFPPLTEERRKELVKTAKKYGEDAKVAIRNIRRDANEAMKKDKEFTEDDRRKFDNDIQKVTDESVKEIDSKIQEKEKEIMSI